MNGELKKPSHAPGIAVIVFRARADVGWEGFPLKIDAFIAFAIPAGVGIEDGERVPHINAAPADVDVVPIRQGPGFDRALETPVGVKQQRTVVPLPRRGGRRERDGDGALAQIFQRQPARASVRHDPASEQGAVCLYGAVPVLNRIEPRAGAKEFADADTRWPARRRTPPSARWNAKLGVRPWDRFARADCERRPRQAAS